MLSAVAARKAAAQASTTPSSKPESPPPPSKSPSPKPSRTPRSADKPTSKRKSRVPANTGRLKTKKVKVTHAPEKLEQKVRYFAPNDASDVPNGIVDAVNDAACEASCSSGSSSGGDMEIEMDVPPPVGLSSISITKTKRAWSPSRPISDSSDNEPGPSGSFGPVDHSTSSTSLKPMPVQLSTFRPILDQNVYPVPENEYVTGGKARILVLQPKETLAVVGAYSLCVLQGSLSLLGVTLSPSNTRHLVFAPRSSPIPILSWAALDSQGSCTLPIPPAVRQQENTTAILIEYADTGVEGLGRICKVFENVYKPARHSDVITCVDLPRICIVNYSTKDLHPFMLPNSWEAALASIDETSESELSSPPVCLVKGPKKSGKSTLARTLVNRLLGKYRRVAFLECDLGQSEFTPGGLVALNLVESYVFGPPFTHPSLSYRAHYIGSTSPRANPPYYLHSIQSLLETYKLELQFLASVDNPQPGDERICDAIPLVVNTMGWNKGLGTDLNTRIEEFAEASHTFDINANEGRGWPAPPQIQHVPRFSTVLPYTRANVRRCIQVKAIEVTNTYQTAADQRHLNILSYFHAIFPQLPSSSPSESGLKQMSAISWDTSVPLCARYPYEVDYTQALDQVYLTGPGYEDVEPSELTRVLNGAIVGLVSVGSTNTFLRPAQSTPSDKPSLSYTPGESPPDPALSTCHGLALIRGIPLLPNPHSPHMHILTPLPTGLLVQTRVLVKGEMELPIWGMLDFREDDPGCVAGVEKAHVPYLQWGKGEGVGGEKRRVRRNLMRKNQM